MKKTNLIGILLKGLLIFFFFGIEFQSLGLASEINIVANKMEVMESEGIAVFTGKVQATRGDMQVFCDKLYVYYTTQEEKKNITKVVALGKVVIYKGKWKAYAEKAVYYKDQEKLVLEDNPKVWNEKNLVEGDIVVLYFNEDRSEVLSKNEGRVRARFYLK
ncbi:lipopolysaccharide transport periplasmic protein LptA [Thermodesulfobacterium sp. TA1]|uniref:lipopolysaccharide transport periplasmic protein LptA n=1 Tax=Thermodesulfobacterium sp. TA1 TaxID=2234087 RepID=UPI001232076C|nr:lipopolysaccharide transport periplasmic protein LptA [Thermodesulfobacterium sp. TA1]QER42156.1 lipopolysaccharide transport periplasmic protein LptA [Thermodesulfobacterium sp. TA1]